MNQKAKVRIKATLFELTIVVVGVLIALAADSTVERYRRSESAQDALEALRSDILNDLEQLELYWSPRLERQIDARIELERFLEGRIELQDSVEFISNVILVSTYYTFDPNTAAMEDLINTSGLGLIRDRGLRNALLQYKKRLENIAEFDEIHRAYFLELTGRLGSRIVDGLALSRVFTESSSARSSASRALRTDHIRSSGHLRELLVSTFQPFLVKKTQYESLAVQADSLIQLLNTAIE